MKKLVHKKTSHWKHFAAGCKSGRMPCRQVPVIFSLHFFLEIVLELILISAVLPHNKRTRIIADDSVSVFSLDLPRQAGTRTTCRIIVHVHVCYELLGFWIFCLFVFAFAFCFCFCFLARGSSAGMGLYNVFRYVISKKTASVWGRTLCVFCLLHQGTTACFWKLSQKRRERLIYLRSGVSSTTMRPSEDFGLLNSQLITTTSPCAIVLGVNVRFEAVWLQVHETEKTHWTYIWWPAPAILWLIRKKQPSAKY